MSKMTRDSYVLGSPVLAEGTNANTFKVTEDFKFVINGRSYHKDAADNIAFSAFTGTSLTAVAALKVVCFFFMIDSAGTITVIQDTTNTSPKTAGGTSVAYEWPDKDGYACIGALTIRTDGSATFTAGSTDLGATDVVDTFVHPGASYGMPVRISESGTTT